MSGLSAHVQQTTAAVKSPESHGFMRCRICSFVVSWDYLFDMMFGVLALQFEMRFRWDLFHGLGSVICLFFFNDLVLVRFFFMCVIPVMEQVGFGFLVHQLFCLWRIWIVRDIQASASWDMYIQKKSDIERSWLNDYIALFSCNSWKIVAGRFYGFLDVCEFLNMCHTIGIKGWISNLLVLLVWVCLRFLAV